VFPAASLERDETDIRLLAARCYAGCLTYSPNPNTTNVSGKFLHNIDLTIREGDFCVGVGAKLVVGLQRVSDGGTK
jgi:hypothetical protein